MFPGLTVCAKTGTGEIGEDKNPNGWMTGFTLDSDCPLAFTIVVENSGFGMAQAGPIAQQLLQSAAVIVREQAPPQAVCRKAGRLPLERPILASV